jgi:hypothetical protein
MSTRELIDNSIRDTNRTDSIPRLHLRLSDTMSLWQIALGEDRASDISWRGTPSSTDVL